MTIVFALERNTDFHVLALRIPLADAALAGAGVKADSDEDRFVGKLIQVSEGSGKHNMPDIVCGESGCFVVWDDEKAGAHAAMIDSASGEVIWRRELGPKAMRPTVARRGNDQVVAWFDDNRVQLAPIDRNGISAASPLGRVNGYQPPPAVMADQNGSDWLVAWRDFEAAKHEAFVLRARCR
jgi:hypothetical protein